MFIFFFIPARICEAVQTSGPVDPAGCVQVAEEALSHSAPDLQRLLQTARHHRYVSPVAVPPPSLLAGPRASAPFSDPFTLSQLGLLESSPSASTDVNNSLHVNHVPNEVPQGHPVANDTLPPVTDQR